MNNVTKIIVKIDESNSKGLSTRRKKRYIKILNSKCNKMFKTQCITIVKTNIFKDYIEYITYGINMSVIHAMYFEINNFKSNIFCANFTVNDVKDKVIFDIAISPKKIYNNSNLSFFEIEFFSNKDETRNLTIKVEEQCRKILSDKYNVNIEKHIFSSRNDIVKITYSLLENKNLKLAMQLALLLERNQKFNCNVFTYKAEEHGTVSIILTEKN